jgi:hypothetical protein
MIYRWVEAGLTHFTETPEGRLFICVATLPAAAAGRMNEASNPDLDDDPL